MLSPISKPKDVIFTEPDIPEDDSIDQWLEKWGSHFTYLEHHGCGCCINIDEFDTAKAAIDEIPSELIRIDLYEELQRPMWTGNPSSFIT